MHQSGAPGGAPPGPRLPLYVHDLRRALRRRRRSLAVIAAATFILSALGILTPVLTPGTDVLVSTRPLEAGQSLTGADVRVVRISGAALPAGALSDPAALPTDPLAHAIPEGLPLTTDAFAEPDGAPAPGRALTSIALEDPALGALMNRGDTLAIHCADDVTGSSRTVQAVVHEAPGATEKDAPTSAFAPATAPSIVVEVSADEVATIAHCTPHGIPRVAIIG
ncbi:MAG: SAF domain-containing protein [Dermabacter sp.]|nr:SAF domain-containing protein [Dermabacter sp.]